ncbi:MAG: hypothetical protein V1662_03330 [Candidatus Omnitrophota bacterium]
MIQKIKKLILMVSLLILFSPVCFAQEFSYQKFFAEREKALGLLQQKNPKLYEFEKRNLEIMQEIQKIKEDYRKKRISKEDAQTKLRPLIKEQVEISTNPEYLIELMLNDIIENPSL